MSRHTEYSSGEAPASHPFIGTDVDEEALEEVRQILLHKRQFDLGMYKDACIRRRIAGRVRARGFQQARPYLDILVHDEAEITTLMAAMTIHVSQFFRNPTTFEVLREEILPDLFRRLRRQGQRELRVWSVGCASGEEPYSMALLLDQMVPPRMKVQIRGCDITSPVLEQARSASFEANRMRGVPQDLREKYFTFDGQRWQLNEKIREMVSFSEHNILGEQPYPEADIILCRNVLIYFSRADQERVLQAFGRSLSSGGVLVLGRAETLIGKSRGMFSIHNPAERIFLRRNPTISGSREDSANPEEPMTAQET